MRLLVGALVAGLLVVGGCGGDGQDSQGSNPSPAEETASSTPQSTPTPSPTPTPAGLSLLQICPQVEAALPRNMDVPSQAQLAQVKTAMSSIFQTGDLEAQNALQLFLDAIDAASAAYQDPNETVPGITASEDFIDGLSAFANRCKAAGSSALQ
jgi:hypothetical protein